MTYIVGNKKLSRIYVILITSFLFLFHLTTNAYTDSHIDTLTPINSPNSSANPRFKYKLPSALFLTGIATATLPPLHNLEISIYNNVNRKPITQNHADNYLQYTPAIAAFALDAAGVKGKHQFAEKLALYTLTNFIAVSIVQPMKYSVHRERPNKSNFKSFPSGHTTTAFAAAELLHQEYGQLSPWISVAGYTTAAATAYLRIHNNEHWLGDVIAGAGIGMASTRLSYWLLPKIKKGLKKGRRRWERGKSEAIGNRQE